MCFILSCNLYFIRFNVLCVYYDFYYPGTYKKKQLIYKKKNLWIRHEPEIKPDFGLYSTKPKFFKFWMDISLKYTQQSKQNFF